MADVPEHWYEEFCEICGAENLDDCKCPKCPVCGVAGDPNCYYSGHMELTEQVGETVAETEKKIKDQWYRHISECDAEVEERRWIEEYVEKYFGGDVRGSDYLAEQIGPSIYSC